MEFKLHERRNTPFVRTEVIFDLETEHEEYAVLIRAARTYKNSIVSDDSRHPANSDGSIVLLGNIGLERVRLAIAAQLQLERAIERERQTRQSVEIPINPDYL